MPPGCIHGTLTLQGGATPRIEISGAHVLEMAAKVFDMNLDIYKRLSTNDQVPLLKSCIMASRSRRDVNELPTISAHTIKLSKKVIRFCSRGHFKKLENCLTDA